MKRIAAGLFILFIWLSDIWAAYSESLNINVESCILIDAISGQVLYEQNADKKGIYPASTTKIMTAIIALEQGELDQVMTASKAAINDIGKDGMHIGIMEGEQIPLVNLLEALLIRSANETANIIAENICSTRNEFVGLMNQKAKEIGAINTHFTNPCGQHDPDHYTTAEDMAKIARYAMTIPKFREIVKKKSFIMPPTNKHAEWPELATTNEFLKYDSNDLFTVTGIKTGYTGPAGQCLVSSAVNKDGMELIAVVMGVKGPSAKKDIREYSKQLYAYGFTNYSIQTIVEQNEIIKEDIAVFNAKDDATVDLVASDSLSCVMPIHSSAMNLEKKEYIRFPIEAPLNKGDVVGYVEYLNDGILLGRVNVIAASTIEKIPADDTSLAVFNNTSGVMVLKKVITYILIILISFGLLRITLRTISRSLLRKRSRY